MANADGVLNRRAQSTAEGVRMRSIRPLAGKRSSQLLAASAGKIGWRSLVILRSTLSSRTGCGEPQRTAYRSHSAAHGRAFPSLDFTVDSVLAAHARNALVSSLEQVADGADLTLSSTFL